LDPKQDIPYYLLGRWNLEISNVGLFSRAVVKVVYGGLPKASYEEAIKQFSEAIALAPNRILHHAGLASAYQATGQKTAERAELEKCLSLKPTDLADADAQTTAKKRLTELR
jgi:tetratricopeptide (TPR) repeat protein